jgi:uncharacterized protein YciI
MTFIYKIKPISIERINNLSVADEAIILEHVNYIKNLKEKGLVKLAGRSEGKEFALCVFEAEGEIEAFKIMQNDPAIKKRLMVGELYPFNLI